MTAAVAVKAVSRHFGSTKALDSVSLNLDAGEFVVLLGPSGCGKTTLLNIIAGFLDPSAGSVMIAGKDVTTLPPAQRPTTTVFQDYALFPHMTVAQNVAFGLRMRRIPRRERMARAHEMLDLVGLPDAARRRPHALSGGQRQRVALARALAVRPDVLLLDEPLGALDLKLRRAMQQELKTIQREVGTTFVHVTHDQEEAMSIADRIVVMNAGVIEDNGPPERVYLRPKSRFAAMFMGEINMLPCKTRTGGVETPVGAMRVAHDLSPDTSALLCIRPEHLLGDGKPFLQAALADAAFFGTHHRALLTANGLDTPLIAHLPPGAETTMGAQITLTPNPDTLFVLPETTI